MGSDHSIETSRIPDDSFGSVFLASFSFAAAHFVTEALIGLLLPIAMETYGPVTMSRTAAWLEHIFMSDMVVEFIYLFPATGLVLLTQVVQLKFWPQRAVHPRSHTWLVAVPLGILYCWAKWLIDGLSRVLFSPLPEPMNFVMAMSLAVIVGLMLILWRQRVVSKSVAIIGLLSGAVACVMIAAALALLTLSR